MHTEYDIIQMDEQGRRYDAGHRATAAEALEVIKLDRGLKRLSMEKACEPTTKHRFIQPMIVGLRFG